MSHLRCEKVTLRRGQAVIVDEVVVGAIGVSGGAVEQDMECARYGISAFLDD